MTVKQFSSRFQIDGHFVGEGCPVYIIAEAGVAHFGNEEKAYQLIDLAAEAGADAVKFQIFDVDEMIAKRIARMERTLVIASITAYKSFERIQAYCLEKKITFFATAHDEPSFEFLATLDVPVYKVGSGEVGNWPYLHKVASQGKPVIFSTGMYRMEQIAEARRWWLNLAIQMWPYFIALHAIQLHLMR